MTRDDIIRMAHEANLHVIDEEDAEFLEAFAALIAAAEREACAKLCDWRTGYIEVDAALEVSGAAIRARGQQ